MGFFEKMFGSTPTEEKKDNIGAGHIAIPEGGEQEMDHDQVDLLAQISRVQEEIKEIQNMPEDSYTNAKNVALNDQLANLMERLNKSETVSGSN